MYTKYIMRVYILIIGRPHHCQTCVRYRTCIAKLSLLSFNMTFFLLKVCVLDNKYYPLKTCVWEKLTERLASLGIWGD